MNPGDTVLVENGTYTGTGENTPCESQTPSRPVVCLARGGSEEAWITFRARNQRGARINGRVNESTDGFVFLEDTGYIRLEGFDVFGMGNANQSGSGFELYSGGHDVVISGNEIHDIGRLCTDTTAGQTGIFVAQPRVTITRNVIHDIGRFAPAEEGCSPKKPYYKNHDHGIYVNGRTAPGGSDVVISNNLFYNHRRGWPIQVYPGTIARLAILNNTFAGENPYNTGQILIGASTVNSRIVNNLFFHPLTVALNFYSGKQTNLIVANNLSSGALARTQPDKVALYNNLEHLDPKVLPERFRLMADSPAIDRGQELPEVAEDLDGSRRPAGAGWDIGAYESPQIDVLRRPRR